MVHQSSGGWCVSGSRVKRKKTEWIFLLCYRSLAVVGSMVGLEAASPTEKTSETKCDVLLYSPLTLSLSQKSLNVFNPAALKD